MAKRSLKAEKTYEASGKRPGIQFSVRLSEAEAKLLDKARGEQARAAWVTDLIKAKIGSNR